MGLTLEGLDGLPQEHEAAAFGVDGQTLVGGGLAPKPGRSRFSARAAAWVSGKPPPI